MQKNKQDGKLEKLVEIGKVELSEDFTKILMEEFWRFKKRSNYIIRLN